MALESYMFFKMYKTNSYGFDYLPSESQVKFEKGAGDLLQKGDTPVPRPQAKVEAQPTPRTATRERTGAVAPKGSSE